MTPFGRGGCKSGKGPLDVGACGELLDPAENCRRQVLLYEGSLDALTNRFEGGGVSWNALEAFNDVEAQVGFDDLAALTLLQGENGLVELGQGLAPCQPGDFASGLSSALVVALPGQGPELDSLSESFEPGLGSSSCGSRLGFGSAARDQAAGWPPGRPGERGL